MTSFVSSILGNGSIESDWRSFLQQVDNDSSGHMIECIVPSKRDLIHGMMLPRSFSAPWSEDMRVRVYGEREAIYRRQAKSWVAYANVFGRPLLVSFPYVNPNSSSYVHFTCDTEYEARQANFDSEYNSEYGYGCGSNDETPWPVIATNPRPDLAWGSLSKRPDFDLNMLQLYPKYMYSFKALSKHPKLTHKLVMQFMDRAWDWTVLSARGDIITPANATTGRTLFNIAWAHMHKNSSITEEFVEQHLDKGWDFFELTKHPCISSAFIFRHIHLGWDFGTLTARKETNGQPSVELNYIRDHPDYPWNWSTIIDRCNTDSVDGPRLLDVVERLIHKPWDYTKLSSFKYLTWAFVLAHMDKPWVKELIRRNSFEHCRRTLAERA